VKSAFLHGELNEEIYVHQPTSFMKIGKEKKVYKLRKALLDSNKHQGLGTTK